MFLCDASSSGSQLLEAIKNWDKHLFLNINTQWTNSFFDSVFPWWRDSNTWVPLYLFLVLFACINFGWKVWPWIVFFILTVALTDQLNSTFIKNYFERPRPCNDAEIGQYARALLGYCSSSYSFPSSHATTHFGMAVFIYLTMRQYFKNWVYLFFFWAATICYGQIYVGVHCPVDVTCGAILGSLVGWLTGAVFNRRIGLPQLIAVA